MYYIIYGFLYLVSLLPLSILYLFSDAVYGFVYYILGYRKEVVKRNLKIDFPDKTDAERKKIAKQFYHNLIDTFIETIKMISASDKFVLKRFTANWEVINKYFASGKNIQLHLGHNFNWEWGNAVAAKQLMCPFIAVYMPFSNKIFDRLFYKLRSRHGTILIRATHMKEDFMPYRHSQYVLGLAADQNPGHPASALWFNFFGRPTPFVKGPSKGAITNKTIVVFAFIHKPKRGYYEAVFSLAEENPAGIREAELTQKFVHYLEDVISKYPQMWLWSHRRWKWEWKPEYGNIIE
jgi:KDO2-lipid IV(A) lauroyltransferase